MKRYFGSLLLCSLLMLSGFGHAGEMDRVVHSVEGQLGVRHTHIPMLGFAMFAGKVATGFQMPGVKLAVFANESLADRSAAELEQAVTTALGPEWTPIVKSTSRHGDEQNWIYLKDEGKQVQMFIATMEKGELSLIQVKASERQLRRWIEDKE
jgi:hypothetical protein